MPLILYLREIYTIYIHLPLLASETVNLVLISRPASPSLSLGTVPGKT